MKKILIVLIFGMPIFCNAQLQIKDTLINGKSYYIYPFVISNFAVYDNLISVAERMPQIPSVADSLPSGEYILLCKPANIYRNRKNKMNIQFHKSKILSVFSISGGLKNGPCKFYHYDGSLLANGSYKNDLREGAWEILKDKLSFKFIYTEGILNGPAYKYYKNKVILTKANYVDNKLIGDYFVYYLNGKLSFYTKYIDYTQKGLLHDDYRIEEYGCDSVKMDYYKNGKVRYKYLCNKGWRSLNHTDYYSNGKIEQEQKVIKYLAEEDRYLVLSKLYNSNGKLYRCAYYKSITQDELSHSVSVMMVDFDLHGDTSDVYYGCTSDYADYNNDKDDNEKIKAIDSLVLVAKHYKKYKNKNVLHQEKYYNILTGVLEKKYSDDGKLEESFDLKFSNDKSLYTHTSMLYRASGKFLIKDYITYKPVFDTFTYTYKSQQLPGSDTSMVYYNDKPITGTIVYSTNYILIDKNSFLKKIKSKFKKNGYYYKRHYMNFMLWDSDFEFKEMTRMAFYKKYGGEHVREFEGDSIIKVMIPSIYRKYKLKSFESYYITNFTLTQGKYDGKVNINSEQISYKNGIKEGVWGNMKYNAAQEYGYYRNGLKNGEFAKIKGEYREAAKIIKREHYTDDTINGPVVVYAESGQPFLFYNYDMGVKQGSFIEINAYNNDTIFKGNMIKGVLDGKAIKNTYKNDNLEENQNPYYRKEPNDKDNAEQKPKQLIKEYEINFKNGYYIGKQYEYGKSGYLMQMVELKDSVECSEKLENDEYNSKPSYRFYDGVFGNASGKHTYYYKTGIIAEEGITDSSSKAGVWKYYREDGTLYKQMDFKRIKGLPANFGTGKEIFIGTITTFHRNNKVYEQGYVSNYFSSYDCNQERELQDEEVAYANVQDSNGNYIFKNGTGDLIIYYPNGLLKARGKQTQYLREGFWIFYDPNGNPIEAGNYVQGERDGRWLHGDLRGFHFIDNQCFSADVDVEILKNKTEKNLEISETIYKLGERINSDTISFEKNK